MDKKFGSFCMSCGQVWLDTPTDIQKIQSTHVCKYDPDKKLILSTLLTLAEIEESDKPNGQLQIDEDDPVPTKKMKIEEESSGVITPESSEKQNESTESIKNEFDLEKLI